MLTLDMTDVLKKSLSPCEIATGIRPKTSIDILPFLYKI